MIKGSVKKPYTVAVCVVLVIVLGVIAFTSMSTDLLPNLDLPYILIVTPYVGASPEKVETTVTKPIEQTISTVSGLKNLSSVSQENSSMVILEFEQSANIDSAMIEISAALDGLSGEFESGVSAPILMRISPDMMPVMALSVDADNKSLEELSALLDNRVIPALERTDGVGSVEVTGQLEQKITFTMEQDMINALNKKVLAAVDIELAEAEQELIDARIEIEDGKEKLEREQKKLAKELADASLELTDGRAEVKDGLKSIEDIIPNLPDMLENMSEGLDGVKDAQRQYQQLLDTRDQLKSALSLRNDLEKMQSALTVDSDLGRTPFEAGYIQLKMSIAELPAEAQEAVLMEYLAPLNTVLAMDPTGTAPPIDLPSQFDAPGMSAVYIGAANSILTAALEQLPTRADLRALNDGIAEFDAAIKTQYKTLNTQLKEMDMELPDDKNFNTLERLRAMRKALGDAQTDLEDMQTELPETQAELEDTLVEIEDGQRKLEEGKMTALMELAKAGALLDIGEQQLEAGEEAFEEARDEAYKNAGLDGVITKEMVSQVLMAQNFSMPAGYIYEGEEPYMVKVGEQFATLDELKDLVLFHTELEGVGDVYLMDVGIIEETDNRDDVYAMVNGNVGVVVTVMKQSTASTSEVCENLRKTMASLEEANEGLHLVSLQDQGIYINMVTESLIKNLLYGGILAVLVLIAFLRDWRPTIIIALSIPISLMFAVVLMYFTGVTLNIISLSGLALGVGMLVDNSIVAIENIYRLRKLGMGVREASVYGVKQLAGALTASTLTTVSVFVPIVFTEGLTRQIFTDMGLTIGYSLMASLIVAMTLVPMMSSSLLHKTREPKKPAHEHKVIPAYAKLLRWSLKHKAAILIPVVVLLIVSALGAMNMGTSLFPEMNSNQMTLTLTTGEGSTNDQIRGYSAELIETLTSIDEVQTVGAMQSDPSGSGHAITMYVIMDEDRKISDEEIEDRVMQSAEDMDCEIDMSFFALDLSMLTGSGIAVEVKGRDLDVMRDISKEIAAMLETVPGTTDVSDGTENGSTELRIEVDKNKAMRYGLTTAQVYQEVALALNSETTATTLTLGEDERPLIVVKDRGYTRETIGSLPYTVTVDDEEQEITLADIAVISEGESPAAIRRAGQTRVMTVSAQIADGYNISHVSRDFEKQFASYEAPAGYEVALAGENEYINQALEDVTYMILLAIVLIYLIMVAQFQSLLSPFIVMFVLPLAFTGAFLALIIFGFEISIVALIGMLMLAGVVVNNGIVFVETVNQLRAEGMERHEALIETGKTRFRPIMMTALTTILALFTMALGVDMGAQLSQPLAVVTIGGLGYATILTLLVVPIMYDIFNKREIKKRDVEDIANVE
ncbi:efflux RND transporter permease subunit [Christensenellaceae bacterium OttesenSCG-928-L17]|nr:efflux RND transporter permease subunit [Christensenellaceae bacterium OttesenSCG-928-L17]